jgi:nucleoside-diphosphate-sugar epimerase
MKKKIFITGVAGYIGTSLLPLLLENGYQVTGYDNLMYGGDQLLPFFSNPNFTFVRGDVLDKDLLSKVIKGHDVVINLAAIVGYAACRANEKLSYDVNHQGTKNVIECLDGSQLLLFASTGSNYGNVDGICTEESPVNPLSIYAKSKHLGEQEVLSYSNSIAFRYATAFGLSPRLRLDLLVNELSYLASTQKYITVYEAHFMRTFIHVRDIAASLLFSIKNVDKMRGQVYNVGSNDMNFSKRDICELIKTKIDCLVNYAEFGSDADQRNYIVSYDKINALGFNTTITVEQGIDELLRAFEAVKIHNKFKNFN